MKLLYVGPRYHPNQVPILTGLVEKGNEIVYCASTQGVTEYHTGVRVVFLRKSILTKVHSEILKRKGSVYLENKMIFWLIPNAKDVYSILHSFNPDMVILRNQSFLSLAFVMMCYVLRIKKVILYVQEPLYVDPGESVIGLKKRWFKLFPKTCITVSKYMSYPDKNKIYKRREGWYYLPFVIRHDCKNRQKMRKKEDINVIKILDSGKYRPYKNHTLLIDAVDILRQRGYSNFYLTVVGQKTCNVEDEYYDLLLNKIENLHLEQFVELLTEIPYMDMPNVFLQNDIYVLASKRELANVSILDAMSYGLPAIATADNGTSHYIKDGETGYIYRDNSAEDLADKLERYLSDKELLVSHGNNAFSYTHKEFCFDKYYQRFCSMVNNLNSIQN